LNKIVISLGFAAVLSGCATKPLTGVNSPSQVAALVSQFNATCETLGGSLVKSKAEGSLGTCVRNDNAADFYVNKDFVLMNSEGTFPAFAKAQWNLINQCGRDDGVYDSGEHLVGVALRGPQDGKVNCRANDWMVTVSAPEIGGGKRKAVVSASARRIPSGSPKEGAVSDESLRLALKYATS
jgi:hypothetical protein